MMMGQARDKLSELDLSRVPPAKIRSAFADLERQIREAETERIRTGWLLLQDEREGIQ